MKMKVFLGVVILLASSLLLLNIDILSYGEPSAFDDTGPDYMHVRHEEGPPVLLPHHGADEKLPIMAHEQAVSGSVYVIDEERDPPKHREDLPWRAMDDVLEDAREEAKAKAEAREAEEKLELERKHERERQLEERRAQEEDRRRELANHQDSFAYSEEIPEVVGSVTKLRSSAKVWPLPFGVDSADDVVEISLDALCNFEIVSDCPVFTKAVEEYADVLRADIVQLQPSLTVTPILSAPSLIGVIIEHVEGPEHTAEERMVDEVFHGAHIPFGYNEGYRLTVPVAGSICIEASDSFGVIHALTTLKQLLAKPSEPNGAHVTFIVPGVPIVVDDSPHYPYRGLMIDSGRSFLSLDLIKRTIDAMSLLKLNVMHWHLTDDQSFPVECLAYPELQEKGAYWMGYVWDKVPIDRGTYSQNDLREVVAYAGKRGIRVIPEVDVPGHCRGWTMAFPEMTVTCPLYQDKKRNNRESNKHLNGDYHVNMPLDVTSEKVYEVVGTFMHEMAAIFSDPVFHIGSDEAPAACWQEDLAFQIRLAEQEAGAPQAYFLSRLHERLSDFPEFENRTLTLWDDGFLDLTKSEIDAEEAVVQFWRSWRRRSPSVSEITSTSLLILSPSSWYLDIPHPVADITDWEKTYFDATFDSLASSSRDMLIGGEACAWMMTESEQMSRQGTWPIHFDTLVWHRLIAIAERLWTPDLVQSPPSRRYEAARCRLASVVPLQPATSVKCTEH